MNAKHTPGPWRVLHESADPEWCAVVASGGRIVANVNAETGPDIPPLVATKMPKEANACLIAAAPELLEAVERLEAGVRLWMSRGVTDEDMAFAKAAILKAKGGSQ